MQGWELGDLDFNPDPENNRYFSDRVCWVVLKNFFSSSSLQFYNLMYLMSSILK